MTKKKVISLIVVGTLIAGTVGFGAWYIFRLFNVLSDYCLKFWKGKINSISFKSVNMTLWWMIYNKSNADIIVTDHKFDIYINCNRVSTVYGDNETTIKPNNKSAFHFNLVFNPLQVLKISLQNLTDLLSNQDNIQIDIEGYASAGTGGLVLRKLPIKYSMTLGELLRDESTDLDEVTC